MNTYGYVGGNPIGAFDAKGLAESIASGGGTITWPEPVELPKLRDLLKNVPKAPLLLGVGLWCVTQDLSQAQRCNDAPYDKGCDGESDCKQEKQACIELCADIAETNDPDRKHVWGGSMSQCIKNCLPERCGGEGLWKGYK